MRRPERHRPFFFTALILIFTLATLVGCNRDDPTPMPTTQSLAPAPAVGSDSVATPVLVATTTEATNTQAVQTAVPAITAALSATVAAPVAPTATLVPDAGSLLSQGQQLFRVGDYAAARETLLLLLQMERDDTQMRLRARYELARSNLAETDYAGALQSIAELDTEALTSGATDADFLSKVEFLRARALAGTGDSSGAIAAWWRFLDAYPWMAEHVQPRIADIYLSLGDVDSAAAALRRAAEGTSDTVGRLRLLETLANTLSGAGRYREAAEVYDEILAVAENSGYRAQMLYQAGQAFSSAGDGATAIDRWQQATAAAPETQSAYLALVELVNRNVEFDLVQRGNIDLVAGAYAPAISAYSTFLESADPTDPRYAVAVHGLANAYLGAEDPSTALPLLDRVINEFPTCECFGQAWLDKAQAQIALGDSAGARRTWRTFARDHSTDPLAAQALWLSGVRALRDDNPVEGAVDFLALAEAFPEDKRAPDALYAVGIGALQKGFHGQAAELFGRLQLDYPEYRWPAVSYWLGRANQSLGKSELARAQWQSLVDKAPDIYYGVLANQALKALPLGGGSMLTAIKQVAGPVSRLPGDDGSQAFAESWLRQWEPFKGIVEPGSLPPEVAADPDLSKGRLLLELDQRTDAVDALERVFERNKDNPVALYPLSLEFARMGAFRESISSMVRLLQFSPAGLVENSPAFLQRYAWPLAFEDLIRDEATANDMDPFLYFSMIRQESLFEEGARSYAAAQGLAQIIPDTARWVAEQKGHPDWSNELIYRPYINVDFGAYYFDWVRQYLDGNPVSALVGYNAGPGNAEAWRELSGPDDTLFVEVLGMSEPRLYVQLITENLYHYTRLYGAP